MYRRVLLAMQIVFWTLLANADNSTKPMMATTASLSHKNETLDAENSFTQGFKMDTYMIQRALYVLIGITVVGLLYFLVKAVRLKKTTTQRKKYGLLSNYDDTMEMTPLESDEDDMTVYEAKTLRR